MSSLKPSSAPAPRGSRDDKSASHHRDSRGWTVGIGVVSAALGWVMLSTSVLAGKDAEIRRHPGFIDGSAFARLADENDELVEVNIGPSLLKAIARGAAKDREAASVLSGLLNVSAYIVDFDDNAAAASKAGKMIADIVAELDRSGWERLVKVREKGELVNVYIRNNDEMVDGLVVLVFDKDEGEVVFANLVGTIDLAKIGELDGALDIPGLDALDEVDSISHHSPVATPPPTKSGASKRSEPTPGDDGGGSRSDDPGEQP